MNNPKEPTKPKYFYCYLDNETIIRQLTDEQAGKLWKMIFAYTNRGEKAEIKDPLISMAFAVITQQIDRDFEKYRKKCEINRANRAKANKCKPLTTNIDDRQQTSTTINDGDQKEDKDKNKNKDKEEDKDNAFQADSSPTSFYTSVIKDFNRICVSLPKVQNLTDNRKKQIMNAKSVLGNMPFDELFSLVEGSDFLTGRNGKWNGCGFDWVFQPANLTKIIEGNYLNKSNTTETKQRNYEEEF